MLGFRITGFLVRLLHYAQSSAHVQGCLPDTLQRNLVVSMGLVGA